MIILVTALTKETYFNDEIEIKPNTRLLNIEPFDTNFVTFSAKIGQIIVKLFSNKFKLF